MNYKSNLAHKEYNNDPYSRSSTAKQASVGAAAGLTLVVNNAQAAVPAEVTTAITGAVTDVATVGAAVLVVIVGIKVFKWIRGAL